MISAEELLKPISPENPCGVDLSYDPGMAALWPEALRGKPETQFSAAEEPNWKQVRAATLELFARSKDLRTAVALCLAELKTDGVAAFREALLVMKGLLTEHWDGVYPRLSADDGNDPTERANILSAMATPLGTYNDPVQFIERLRSAPLAVSLKMGKITKADIEASKAGATLAGGKAPLSAAQIKAAFQDSKAEELQTIGSAINDSITVVKEIDGLLKERIGYDKAPNLGPLLTELTEMKGCLAAYITGSSGGAAMGEIEAPQPGKNSGPEVAPADGIRNSDDVVRRLEEICEYYKKNEPSSPVPQLLDRAKRLAKMDFLQAISDLSPDAMNRMKDLFGIKDESSS